LLGGLIKFLIKWGARLVAVAIPSLICFLIPIQAMKLNPDMPRFLVNIGMWSSFISFCIGWVALLKIEQKVAFKFFMIVGATAPTVLLIFSFIIDPPPISLPAVNVTMDMILIIIIGLMLVLTIIFELRGKLKKSEKKNEKQSSIIEFPSFIESRISGPENLVGAIEIVEFPDSYIIDRESSMEANEIAKSMISTLRSLRAGGVPVGFRIERVENQNRVLILTYANSNDALRKHLDHLHNAIRTYMPGFVANRHNHFMTPAVTSDSRFMSAQMIGEPLPLTGSSQSMDGLTHAVEALQRMENGIIQVIITPTSSSRLSRWSIQREYEKELERSKKTVVTQSSGLFRKSEQESQMHVDITASTKAEKLARELRRHRADYPCNVGVYVTTWAPVQQIAEVNAKLLIQTLIGSFIPAGVSNDLKFRLLKKSRDSLKLLRGHPVGESTLLLVEEAATYLILPRRDMGLKTSRRESFSTATREPIEDPFTETATLQPVRKPAKNPLQKSTSYDQRWFKVKDQRGLVILGFPLRANGERLQGELIWFTPTELQSHLGIFGNTRSGKTTTAISVISQLIRFGIFPIIFVPAKNHEWRILKTLYPDLRIFSAGNPNAFSLKLNM